MANKKNNVTLRVSYDDVDIHEDRRRERKSGTQTVAKKSGIKSEKEERSLDVCLRLSDKTFRWFSLPGISTTLNRLRLSSSSSSSSAFHQHGHKLDESPVPLDTAYDILDNRFPVVLPDDDHFKGPFPLPGTTGPLFSSAVVGSTLYCLGGDRNDIQRYDVIEDERFRFPNRPSNRSIRKHRSPPPRNRVLFQLYNLAEMLLSPSMGSTTLHSTDTTTFTSPWGDVDPAETTTSTSPLDDATPADTTTSTSPGDVNPPGDVTPMDTTLTETTTLTSPADVTPIDTTSTDAAFTSPWDTSIPEITANTPTITTNSPTTTTSSSTPETLKGICHQTWTLDLRNPGLGWSEGKALISPRMYPILVPYQGKLYAFSGNLPSLPFAEVYDPVAGTWTQLPPAPFGWLPDSQMYVVPLKGWNKIWVFGHNRPVDYTFDVLTGKWQKFRGSRDIIPLLNDAFDLVSALSPDNRMAVYWINNQLVVHAYDFSTNQIFKSALSGADWRDHEEELLGTPLCLHHLHRDLFCLIGATHSSEETTVLHVTILQISMKASTKFSKGPSKIHKTPPNPLTAAVVACFAYPLKGEIIVKDSYIMSNNIGKGNA